MGCDADDDCADALACDQNALQCADPCENVQCGRGSCRTVNHRPVCHCQDGYRQSETDGLCVDVDECRGDSPCHPTARCANVPGSFKCTCRDGQVGDAYSASNPGAGGQGCQPKAECLSHADCPAAAACSPGGRCVNPCDGGGGVCGEGADCQVKNHQPRCQCPPRTTGDPLERCSAMECVDNPDCPSGRSCVDNRCQNVCSFDGVCGANSDCTTIDNRPFCACRPGHTGDPRVGCTKIQQCAGDAECSANMLCAFGVCTPRCSTVRDCLENQVCVSGRCTPKCRGIEDCPINSECRGGVCKAADQCRRHGDCPSREACIVDSASGRRGCQDVCRVPNVCGKNAGCNARNHKAQCRCPSRYYGNPDEGCEPKECSRNRDCPGDQKCQNYRCIKPPVGTCYTDGSCKTNEICTAGRCRDPCSDPKACGVNALCSTAGHRKLCSCPPQFTGNSDVECVRIPTTCVSEVACPASGMGCHEGICMLRCGSDNECASNERCNKGQVNRL